MKTIAIKEDLKPELDKLKIHKRETYSDVIDRLIKGAKEKPQ